MRQRRQDTRESFGVPSALDVARAADRERAAPGIGGGDDGLQGRDRFPGVSPRGLLFLGLEHGFEGRREAQASVWLVGIRAEVVQGGGEGLDGFVVARDRGERLQPGQELMAAFACAAVGVEQDVGERSGEAGIGVGEEGEVLARAVEELGAPGGGDGFGLGTLGVLPPGGFSRVVLAEAGYDAGVPVGACCRVREVGTLTEEGPVDVECIVGVGLQYHKAVVRRVFGAFGMYGYCQGACTECI